MEISSDLINQVFALPADKRFELAHRLLDSIDTTEAAQFDDEFIAELDRRRDEMLRGEETIDDWRAALAEIRGSLDEEQ